MNRILFFKSAITALLVLLILIPLHLVDNTVQDRRQYRDQAVRSVWQSYAGPQTLTGPVLVLPYKEVTRVADRSDPKQPNATVLQAEEKQMLVFPATLRVSGDITPNERYRGIHKVLVYELQSRWQGTIALPDAGELPRSAGHVSFEPGQPFVAIGLGDTRGLMATPTLELDGKRLKLEQGAGLKNLPQGLHADIDLPAPKPAPEIAARTASSLDGATGATGTRRVVPFSLTLPLLGAQSLAFAPVADQNDISLASAWPHPSFDGTFLPRTRSVDAGGFRSNWSVTAYNTRVRNQLAGSGDGMLETVSVTLIEPVNVYLQVERAVKYGSLFVLLTFAGFFMFELVKRLRIHPIQYLLVGLALAVFFLLLLSLSEHIAFALAYLAASTACIGLLGFYLSFVLQSWRRGLAFAVLLTVLYGALYGLLLSEDNALMLGSLLLFVILAAIMVLTRRIDWYAAGAAWQPLRDKPEAPAEAPAGQA
ncbi:cell envelope integrity protein CreD [Cupriavidus sp. M-11]|uniref:cell envelope integrity protein CreD n=1 Tax=Cupriavidus sp. M-11 TaxID=3233038 RepID=UPI003F917D9E